MSLAGQLETFPASPGMSHVGGRPDVPQGRLKLRFLANTGLTVKDPAVNPIGWNRPIWHVHSVSANGGIQIGSQLFTP